MSETLYQTFNKIGHPRVLVLGDPILDHYVWGDSVRISPEAPIPVVKQQGEDFKPGGAGSVCFNLQQLEAKVTFCGVIGDDVEAAQLRGILDNINVDLSGLLSCPRRITNRKTRFIARAQQMLRVDREITDPIPEDTAETLIAFLDERIPDVDIVVVSDYDKGVVTPQITAFVAEKCRLSGIPCLCDPAKISDYSRYRGFTLLSPNRAETETATGIEIRDGQSLRQAARKLLDEQQLEYVVITRDQDGISLFGRDGTEFQDPTQVRAVYDVTGAGDMVTSVLGLVMGDGKGVEDAVRLANIAAGIEVTKLGVAPVSRQEMREAFLQQASTTKVKTLDELLPLLSKLRVANRKIVFTNGCFDILHQGHIDLLQTAKTFGDTLVVAINSDASVRRLKGPKRPILTEDERSLLLSAIAEVDFVIVFDEPDPIPLLEAIRPEVLAKGAQYSREQVVGHEVVDSYGGEIKLIPHVEGISTTDIVTRILERHRQDDE